MTIEVFKPMEPGPQRCRHMIQLGSVKLLFLNYGTEISGTETERRTDIPQPKRNREPKSQLNKNIET